MNIGQAPALISLPEVYYFSDVQRVGTYGWFVANGIWFADYTSMHEMLGTKCNLVPAPANMPVPQFHHNAEEEW